MSVRVVDPDTFAVPWAIRDSQVVHLKGFDGQREGLLCGGCGKPVIYKRGDANGRTSPHFAHKADGSGGCSLMTTTHRIFRDATAAAINAAGAMPPWMLNAPRPLTEPVPGVAEVEALIPGTSLRADVLFRRPGNVRTLALEVVVTKGIDATKRDTIHEAGAAVAVLTVERNLDRFAGCQDDAAMQAVAVAEIKARLGFKLLSPPVQKVAPSPRQVVVEASDGAAFECPEPAYTAPVERAPPPLPPVVRPAPRPSVGPVNRAHDEYRRTHSLLGPIGHEEAARRMQSWARVNAGSPGMPRCCPDARTRTTSGPASWRCATHNRWGWA